MIPALVSPLQTTALICTNSGIVIKTSFHKFCDKPTQMWALQWSNFGQTTALICTNSRIVIKTSFHRFCNQPTHMWALRWSNWYSNSGTIIKTWTMQCTNFHRFHSYRFTSLEITIDYLSIGISSLQHFLIPTTMNPFKKSASFLKHLANFLKQLANFLHLIQKVRTNKVLLGLLVLTKTAGGTSQSLSPEIMAKLNPVAYQNGFYAIGEKIGHQAAFSLETDLSRDAVQIKEIEEILVTVFNMKLKDLEDVSAKNMANLILAYPGNLECAKYLDCRSRQDVANILFMRLNKRYVLPKMCIYHTLSSLPT